MAMQKDQKPLCTRNKCPPPSSRAGGRKSRSTGSCHSSLTLQLFTACPWLLCPARYLFLDPFFVEASVLSAHQFKAAFPLPVSVENTIKEKNQCILEQ